MWKEYQQVVEPAFNPFGLIPELIPLASVPVCLSPVRPCVHTCMECQSLRKGGFQRTDRSQGRLPKNG